MNPCPCGSGLDYEACCRPFIDGTALPPTAEALMRSRYSAFSVDAIDYLHDTLAHDRRDGFDRGETERWARDSTWLGLDIVGTQQGGPEDSEGVVAFSARFKFEGKDHTHYEVSRFRRDDGRWVYVDGQIGVPKHDPRRVAAIGRNDPCPCGSGKKFKKCCAA
jgi:SEC-C motif-containing protein